MIELITFDLDNTLWDVTPVIIRAEKKMRGWLTERVPNYAEVATPEYMNGLRSTHLGAEPELRYNISALRVLLLTQALRDCGLTHTSAREHADAAFEIFMHGRNDVEFFPEALPAIEQLARSYRLAGLTNGNADITDMPLANHFEFCLSPEQVRARKPEPQIFAAMLERAGVSATQVVHVGDHLEEDVGGAVAAGWRAVWVNPTDAPDPADAVHHASINDLSELPGVIARLNQQ